MHRTGMKQGAQGFRTLSGCPTPDPHHVFSNKALLAPYFI